MSKDTKSKSWKMLPGKFLKKLWSNKKLSAVLFVVIVGVCFALFSTKGVLQRVRMEKEKTVWKKRIEEEMREQERLRRFSGDLDTSRFAIEKVAREEYGMIRPGEKVYRVRKSKKE
ncbi:MAG: septum formation initiator family protein [Ignavibacteriales bacterium]|nr:septum formation initiator family protein [Ignavibacteriales bacterium]